MGACREPHAQVVWARQFHAGSGAATGVALDADGSLAVGGYVFRSADLGLGPIAASARGDAVLAVFEGDGRTRWAHTFAGDAAQVTTVAFDRGSVWGAGVFGRFVTIYDDRLNSPGSPDAFLVHAGTRGERLGAVGLSGSEGDRILAIVPRDGEAFVAGYYSGTPRFGGTALPTASRTQAMIASTDGASLRWAHGLTEARVIYEASSLPDGDVAVVGLSDGPDGRIADAFMARVDRSGALAWSMGFGGPGEDQALAVASDREGNLVVIARIGDGGVRLGDASLEGPGIVLCRFDGDGDLLWARVLNRGDPPTDMSLAIDAVGNAIVPIPLSGVSSADGFEGLVSEGRDVLIATYDPDGEPVEGVVFGGDRDVLVGGIASDGCGAFALVGSFGGTLVTDGGTLTASEVADGFVTRWTQ
jgi:hypothetical protein